MGQGRRPDPPLNGGAGGTASLVPPYVGAQPPERLGDLAVRLFSPAYGGQPLSLPEREIDEPQRLE